MAARFLLARAVHIMKAEGLLDVFLKVPSKSEASGPIWFISTVKFASSCVFFNVFKSLVRSWLANWFTVTALSSCEKELRSEDKLPGFSFAQLQLIWCSEAEMICPYSATACWICFFKANPLSTASLNGVLAFPPMSFVFALLLSLSLAS